MARKNNNYRWISVHTATKHMHTNSSATHTRTHTLTQMTSLFSNYIRKYHNYIGALRFQLTNIIAPKYNYWAALQFKNIAHTQTNANQIRVHVKLKAWFRCQILSEKNIEPKNWNKGIAKIARERKNLSKWC